MQISDESFSSNELYLHLTSSDSDKETRIALDVKNGAFKKWNIPLPEGFSALRLSFGANKFLLTDVNVKITDGNFTHEIHRCLLTGDENGVKIDTEKNIKGNMDISGCIFLSGSIPIDSDFFLHLAEKTTELDSLNSRLTKQAIFAKAENAKLTADKDAIMASYKTALENSNKAQSELAKVNSAYNEILNCTSWKLTKPFRKASDAIKSFFRRFALTRNIYKVCVSLKNDGYKTTVFKIKNKLSNNAALGIRSKFSDDTVPQKVKRLTNVTVEELQAQRNTVFDQTIKFSIIVPLYNTPINFLKEMIDSVISQTYENWELCLADGSDSEHDDVGETVRSYMCSDSRIIYKKLEKNLGISENTNACIDMSSGDYIALLDHDDLLHPSALFEIMKAICDKDADYIYTDEIIFKSPKIDDILNVNAKPDYGPDTLRGINYICHFSAFSRELMDKTGRFRSEYDGSQDHDLILRLTANAHNVVHIPKLLYYWRSHANSVASSISAKSYAIDAGRRAVRDHIASLGMKAEVLSTKICPTAYRIKYEITSYDKVSIIIPNKNHLADLFCCINSILEKSTYPNYEIVIVDNGSDDKELFSYYDALRADDRFVICSLDIPFNYSTLNNFASKKASGKYYILLNNDIEIISPEWIEEMLMYVQRDDVGICGAKLCYPDNTLQHAGVLIGMGGVAGHCYHAMPRNFNGHLDSLVYAHEMSAVTAACLMIKASVYEEVGGLDEEHFKVAFNDVDLCLKVRQAGYLVVWTPYAEAYHYESKSRGYEDTPEKIKRFQGEINYFKEKWSDILKDGDPYYNPNLALDKGDYSLK